MCFWLSIALAISGVFNIGLGLAYRSIKKQLEVEYVSML